MEPTMEPTIGRIVHYRLSQQDLDYIASRVSQSYPGPSPLLNALQEGDVCAAVVVRVWDVGINLHVLLDGQLTHWATSRPEGTEAGTWSWPERA